MAAAGISVCEQFGTGKDQNAMCDECKQLNNKISKTVEELGKMIQTEGRLKAKGRVSECREAQSLVDRLAAEHNELMDRLNSHKAAHGNVC
jgi:hypothetical protein